ncbi:MAG: DMT family transporter [Candidatus Rokubacteria bacterium]|nr:DMT family transporter [Candidatus Rokubacteria bacterium]
MDLLAGPGLGALCALGSALLWGVTSLLVRTLTHTINAVTVNAVRSVLAGALLLAWVLATHGLGALTAMSAWTFMLLSVSIVLALAVGDSMFFESTRALGLGRAMTISTTYPLISAVLAVTFLGEVVTAPVVVGSVITLGGLALIVGGRADDAQIQPGRFWPGVAQASVASIAWAVSVVFMKAPLAELDATVAQAVRLPLAGLLLLATPWARGAARHLAAGGRGAVGRMAALVVLTAVSSVMFVASVKYAGITLATVLSSTAPMFAIPLGFVFLGERLPAVALVGAAITVAGLVVLRL